MVKFKVVRLCKQEAMSIAPSELVRFDLDKAARLLSSNDYGVEKKEVMLVATKGSIEITLYRNGRMPISPVESKEQAQEIATAVYAAVEGSLEASPLKSL